LIFSGTARGAVKDIDAAVEASREAQISVTQEFLKIESYNQITDTYSGPYPVEGVEKSLRFILEKAEEMGFKTVLHQWEGVTNARGPLYGYVEFGPENAPEMIMSLAHLDTVPPGNSALWTLGGPFEAKIVDRDGEKHIVGRGAFDDKGPAMATLYSLKAIKESGVPLTRRIRLFFGTTEDYGGWNCVRAYADDATAGKEEWPTLGFSPDSGSFQPTYIEKTSVNVAARNPIDPSAAKVKLTSLKGGTATNAVSDNCKATLEGDPADLEKVREALTQAIDDKKWDLTALPITISSGNDGKLLIDITGRAAHSGEAWSGIGANNRMIYLLSKVPFEEDWQVIAQKTTGLLPPDEGPSNMGEALGIREGGLEYSDLISVNMGLLSSDVNADSGKPEIYCHVNIRYAGPGADVLTKTPHQTGEAIKAKVDAKFKEAGLLATLTGGGVPYTVPMDSEIMTKLQKAYEDITGKPVTPCITIGGTYAAAWSNSKLSADSEELFGYRMVSWGIDGGIGMHESNESMSVEKLIEATKIMARAMVYLASAADSDSGSGSSGSGCSAAGWGVFALATSCVALYRFRMH
jgi:succinyl-diaminopimelate desuccinylase